MDNDQLAYVFIMLFFVAMIGAGAAGTLAVLWAIKKWGRRNG